MIIVLKGANFSASNIGTLETWSINIYGSGFTYTGDTSVDRESNTGFTKTITLNANYELNGSVTVTEDGKDITNKTTISQNGNVIKVTYTEKVTGTVYISVPTKNTVTGEGDGGNSGNTGANANVVFDFDFTTSTLAAYSSQGIFTVPDTSTIDAITYDTTYGANLNSNLPYGLTLINPIDASRAWTLEFTAYFATPTDLVGNRRALLTGGDDILPFCVINATNLASLGFQISSGSHKYVGGGQLTYDAEATYKIVHDGSANITAYKNGASIGTTTVDFAGKTFCTILGVIKGKSTAYTWQDVEDGKKSYLHKIKFYYN